MGWIPSAYLLRKKQRKKKERKEKACAKETLHRSTGGELESLVSLESLKTLEREKKKVSSF